MLRRRVIGPSFPHVAVPPAVVSGFTPTSAESSAYLGRTSGLDDTRKGYLDTLITNLVNDGVWAQLDALYIFANADATNAVLNLVSSSYTCVPNGSPTFTVDRGFTGADNSTTKYLDTQLNGSTATHYLTNTGHLSAWCVADVGAENGSALLGIFNGTVISQVVARYIGDSPFFWINSTSFPSAGVSSTSSQGHWIADRTAFAAVQGYTNGSAVGPGTIDGATTPPNGSFYILARNTLGTGATDGTGNQMAAASIGGALGSSLAASFYTRLRTYMTAVGVP